MKINIVNNKYKSILCLQGDLPDTGVFLRYQLPIIATDGAANALFAKKITPNVIIGDLDSLDFASVKGASIIKIPCQETSDYQKALTYLKDNNLLPTIVFGIAGGHLDHILNNINIFMDSGSLLYSPPIIGEVLHGGRDYKYKLQADNKISLLGVPNAIVSTRGLKWELLEYELAFPGKTSCFNRTIKEDIQIKVHSGKVLILIYENKEK